MPIYKWSDFSCGRFNKLTNEHRYSMRPSRTKRFQPTRSMFCNLFIPFINSRDFHGHDHFTSMLFPRQASHHPTAAMNCPMINFGLYLLRYLVAEFGLSVSQWVHPVCGPIKVFPWEISQPTFHAGLTMWNYSHIRINILYMDPPCFITVPI